MLTMESEIQKDNIKTCMNGFAPIQNLTPEDPVLLTPAKNNLDILKCTNPEEQKDDSFNSEIPILQHLFKEIYQKRIIDVENSDANIGKKHEDKIDILQSYIQQLEEQNDVLVSAMLELEKEAYQRVRQMENRLKSSAKSTMEAVVNVHDFEQEMRKLVNERLHLESLLDNMQHYFSTLKVENSFLRDQNFNLNHDVQALLHIIHHARSTGHWEMDCVTFCEVTPEQVFGPVQSLSQLYSTDSPNSSSHVSKVAEKEQKVLVDSNLSSQDISHSSLSSPSADTPLGLTQVTQELDNMHFLQEAHEELLKRDKTIAILETRVAELRHQLSVKELDCMYHLWKIEALTYQNQKHGNVMVVAENFPGNLLACDMPLPKCISLPDIGNIYSYANVIRKSHSCRTIIEDCYRLNFHHPTKTSICRAKPSHIKGRCTASERSKNLISKPENLFGFQRSQSEPHLYMYGDNVYVYRPCEQIKRSSNFALNEDFRLSFPPCQSIDLKFPTDNANLKVCEWDFVHNPQNYSVPVTSSETYQKIDISSSSCTTSESEDIGQSKSNLCNNVYIPNISYDSFLSSTNEKCSHHQIRNEVNSLGHSIQGLPSNVNKYSKQDSALNFDICEEDKKIEMCSIGLQVDLQEVKSVVNITKEDLTSQMDVQEINRKMQNMKDNLLKAEDKAAAKEILIEQLQGHISTAFKEVEMKDEVLHNIEKKLNLSRSECVLFKQKITSLENEIQELLSDLKKAKLRNDDLQSNVDTKKEQIEEIKEEQKSLQNQKRTLMTQLDAQDDQLQNVKRDLEIMILKAQSNSVQVEQQNQIIKSLQEALVQSKRAFDAAHQNKPLLPNNVNLQTKDRQFSKSSIVDI